MMINVTTEKVFAILDDLMLHTAGLMASKTGLMARGSVVCEGRYSYITRQLLIHLNWEEST